MPSGSEYLLWEVEEKTIKGVYKNIVKINKQLVGKPLREIRPIRTARPYAAYCGCRGFNNCGDDTLCIHIVSVLRCHRDVGYIESLALADAPTPVPAPLAAASSSSTDVVPLVSSAAPAAEATADSHVPSPAKSATVTIDPNSPERISPEKASQEISPPRKDSGNSIDQIMEMFKSMSAQSASGTLTYSERTVGQGRLTRKRHAEKGPNLFEAYVGDRAENPPKFYPQGILYGVMNAKESQTCTVYLLSCAQPRDDVFFIGCLLYTSDAADE